MLKKLRERTVANLGNVTDIDAFAYASSGEYGVVSVALVRGNKMMGVKNYRINDASMTTEELFSTFLGQYYALDNELPQEICLEEEFDTKALSEYLGTLTGKPPLITFPKRAQGQGL